MPSTRASSERELTPNTTNKETSAGKDKVGQAGSAHTAQPHPVPTPASAAPVPGATSRGGIGRRYRPHLRHGRMDQGSATPHPLLPVVNETSAGGVIVSVQGGRAYTAVIARRNRGGRLEWCLPKGHLEGLETAEEAAIREVSEETGITGRVLRHLSTIDYWFSGTDRRVHKVVHHFLLEALSGTLTTENDPDHEAEKVEWVLLDRVPSRLAYPNERQIIAVAREILLGRD